MQRADFKKTDDMFNRVLQRDDIGVVALLESKETGDEVHRLEHTCLLGPKLPRRKIGANCVARRRGRKVRRSVCSVPAAIAVYTRGWYNIASSAYLL